MVSLDTKAGDGQFNYLEYMNLLNKRLIEANLTKNLEIIDEVLPLIEDINETMERSL